VDGVRTVCNWCNWSDVSKCFGHDISRDSYPSRTVNIIHSFRLLDLSRLEGMHLLLVMFAV
jgi:hypothetical protein